MLQSIGQFETSREHLLKQRKSAEGAWRQIGAFFQIERTLDETYYPSLNREALNHRNRKQVVTRECKQTARGNDVSGDMRPILMVPQLWIWLAGRMTISAFTPIGENAGRFTGQEVPQGDEVGGLWSSRGLGKDSLRGARYPEDFVAKLLADQVHRFGHVQGSEEFPSPLDIFELGVVQVLSSVAKYMENNTLTSEDIATEMELVEAIADIRDELAMVDEILRQQDTVLDGFIAHIKLVNAEKKAANAEEVEIPEGLADTKAQIKIYRDRVSKTDRDAERVDKTVQDRLNLKRTFASINDARASMSDAKTSLLLAIAVIGFTVITILFAPLAFMTALFALDIDELAKHKTGKGDDAVYTSGYIAGTFCTPDILGFIE